MSFQSCADREPVRGCEALSPANRSTIFLSAPSTFAEIRYGIESIGDPIRRAELDDWLQHKVRPVFDQRVLEVSEEVMFKWRLLVEEGRKVGHTFSQPDLMIAATALHHGLTVVTRDTGDYKLARVLAVESVGRRSDMTWCLAISVASSGRNCTTWSGIGRDVSATHASGRQRQYRPT